jgi:hypothetical protein
MSYYTIADKIYIDSSGNIGIGTVPKSTLDLSSKSDGIIIPSGTTAQRSSNPINGLIRYNTQLYLLELYLNGWSELGINYNILNSATPTIISSDGGTITVTGKNFVSDMSFNLVGRNGIFYDISQTIIDVYTAIITTNADISSNNQPYTLYARLPNGQTFSLEPAFTIDTPPTFITAAGSLGLFNTGTTISGNTIRIDVSDNGSISNMVVNAGLSGSNLSFNYTGAPSTFATITGTPSTPGTYNFTVTVYDNFQLSASRTFSITTQSIPANPWASLEASDLVQSNNTKVSSWGVVRTFTQATDGNRPVYFSTGGYNNNAYVSFVRASSTHLAAGSQTINLKTNGGFTAMVQIKFITLGAWERIFDFGNGSASSNIWLGRADTQATLRLEIFNPSVTAVTSTASSLVQNEWAVWTARYNSSTRLMEIYKNNVLNSSLTSANDFIDRTLSNTYIGRSNWSDPYLDAHMSKLFLYDRLLTTQEMTNLYNYMVISTPIISPATVSNLTASTYYGQYDISYSFTATSGPITWSVTPTTYGNISSNGVLSISFPKPTIASGTFTVTAANAVGSSSVSWNYTVNDTQPLPVITSSTPDAINQSTASSQYQISYSFTAANGPITWSVTPTTYGDISSNGSLTITFAQDTTASGTFTVTATNGAGNASVSWNYNVTNVSELYSFTTFTFTNATATGRTGPTLVQCKTAYNTTTYPWLDNTSYFNVVTQGIQQWTVPRTGYYYFRVAGARGGNTWNNTSPQTVRPGGAGRIISQSNVYLTANTILYLVVGQHGGDTVIGQFGTSIAAAGGGGSFVYQSSVATANCRFVGGGGGGATWDFVQASKDGETGVNGSSGGNAREGNLGGAGGTNGAGGAGGAINGGNGTNLVGGDGAADPNGGGGGGMGVGDTGATFLGGVNLQSPANSKNGGFGGGGACGAIAEYGGRGGGGGYSGGGGGGAYNRGGVGGGGGSYSAFGTGYNNNYGLNTGHGYIYIEFTST